MSRPRTRVVGRPLVKVDAAAKVTGQTRFADDVVLPRMLHCKLLRSKRAHARLLRVDASKAARAAGRVRRRDGTRSADLFRDPARVPGRACAVRRPGALRRRSRSPPSAAVDEDDRRRRAAAIEVEYEDLTPIGSIEEAHPDHRAAHPRLRRPRQLPQARLDGIRRRRGGVRATPTASATTLLLRGQHAPADRAARRGRRLRARREADAVELDADATLRSPRARESARDARGAHPRDRDAQRRRIRRQVAILSTTRSSSRSFRAGRGRPSRSA